MKRFIVKTVSFLATTCLGYILCMFIVPELVRLPEIPDKDFSEIKRADVLIVGDSRADKQMDPSVIHSKTGLNTLNIADPSWDVYSVAKNLGPLNLKGKIIIVSISSSQVNDGVVSKAYFRAETFMDLTPRQKLSMYKSNLNDLYYLQNMAFKTTLFEKSKARNIGNDSRKMNIEFGPLDCSEHSADNDWFSRHPWYKKLKSGGQKQALTAKGLQKLSLLKDNTIIVINGPVSPDFRDNAKKNGIYAFEKEFEKFLFTECGKYSNMHFYSFLDDSTYVHYDFYDPQHLCGNGIVKFSTTISDIVNKYK